MTRRRSLPARFCIHGLLVSFFVSGMIPTPPARGFEIVKEGPQKGEVALDVQFRYAPTPDVLAEFKTQMARAQHLLCDATDGQIKLNRVRVSAGGFTEERADVWMLPQTGRSYATRGGGFPGAEGRVTMFSGGLRDFSTYEGTVIAHELGHYLFGLGDSYQEGWRLGGACGIGPSFDPRHNQVQSSPQTWNSIMQSHGMVCRYFGSDAAHVGKKLSDFNEEFGNRACLSDADCRFVTCNGGPGCPTDAGSGKWKCEGGGGATTPAESELSVALDNDCLRTGAPNDDACEPQTEVRPVCPAVRPGKILRVRANVNPADPFVAPAPGMPGLHCGDGRKDPGEQCDMGKDNGAFVFLTTRRFSTEPAGPDNLPVACGEFGIGAGSGVRCANNCAFDKLICFTSPGARSCDETAGKPEACQSDFTVGGSATCESLGLGAGSTVAACGNGRRDPGEECDLGESMFTGSSPLATVRFSNEPAGPDNGPVSCSDFGASVTSSRPTCTSNCTMSTQFCSFGANACAAVAMSGTARACQAGPTGPVLPGGVTCDSLGLAAGELGCDPNCLVNTQRCGALKCLFNCSLDATNCSGQASSLAPVTTTVAAAAASVAVFAGPYALLDAGGVVQRSDGHLSGAAHELYLAFQHQSTDRWWMFVLGRATDFAGAAAGDEVVVVAARQLTFTGSTLATINGAPATDAQTITIGDSPAFLNGAAPMTLELSLDLVQDRWRGPDDPAASPRLGTSVRRGTGFFAGDPAGTSAEQIGRCTAEYGSCKRGGADYCAAAWNATTGRFESTDQTMDQICSGGVAPNEVRSDWQLMAANLASQFGFELTVPDQLPVPGSPNLATDCGGPITFDVPASFDQDDAIVVVIDRSDSMRTPVDASKTYGKGSGETRLAYAKAAARSFVDSLVGAGIRVGLVSFNQTVTIDQPLAKVVDAGPAAGEVSDEDFKQRIDAFMPGGRTAIGSALATAGQLLAGVPAMGKAVILVSDGENNEPPDPTVEAGKLRDAGVRIFTIPVGNSADEKLAAQIAEIGQGKMLTAPTGDELPATFFEALTSARGEGLALARRSSAVVRLQRCGGGEFPCNFRERVEIPGLGCFCVDPENRPQLFTRDAFERFTFEVETGAARLNLMISGRNRSIGTWNPDFAVRDPAGQVRAAADQPGTYRTDPFFRLISLSAPPAGTWTLEIAARDEIIQNSYVIANVENRDPDCFADAKAIVVDGAPHVEVTANALYRGAPVRDGVRFLGVMTRPDGIGSFFSFEQVDPLRGGRALVPMSSFVGRGSYEVRVTCSVAADAQIVPGEANQIRLPENRDDVGAFARTAVTTVFFDSTTQPPLPVGGDCDGNGVPDDQEPPGDSDGDGRPDVCDGDDDNDDVSDVFDPAPRNPLCASAGCPLARIAAPPALECVGGTARATLDGTASSDPDGDPLTFAWTSSVALEGASSAIASGVFPLGTTAATLAVSDGRGGDSATTVVTVLDTTGPLVAAPADVLTESATPALGAATATDGCGGDVTLVNDAPAIFPVGTTIVTWHGVDRFGNVGQTVQRVTRQEVVAGDALLVVAEVPALAADAAIAARLQRLGYRVTLVDDDVVRRSDASGKAVIVVAESSRSMVLGGVFADVAVPIVSSEPLLWPPLGMTGAAWQSDVGDVPGGQQVTVRDAGHPLAAGLSGTVTVATAASKLEWGRPAATAARPVSIGGAVDKAAVFGYEAGAQMKTRRAPARRVGFFAGDPTAASFTAAGGRLFDAAVTWATRRADAVLVVAARPLAGADEALRLRLERMHYGVHVRTGGEVQASQAAGKAVIVVSESTSSSTLNGRLTAVTVPMLSMEPAVFDELGMTGDRWGLDQGDAMGQVGVDIVAGGHSMAAGRSGFVTLFTSPQKLVWGAPSASAERIATIAGHSDRVSVFGYAKGAQMVDRRAPAARVGWLAGHPSVAALNEGGWALFRAAIAWATGEAP